MRDGFTLIYRSILQQAGNFFRRLQVGVIILRQRHLAACTIHAIVFFQIRNYQKAGIFTNAHKSFAQKYKLSLANTSWPNPLHWWEPLHLICKWQKEPSLKKSKCDAIIFIALMISSRISECDWFVKVMEIGFVPTSLLSDSISLHKASRRCNNLKKFDKYKRWSE